MVLGGRLFLFWSSVVDVPSLGLLFGRDFLDGVGAVLNFHRRLFRCDRLDTGHFLCEAVDSWAFPFGDHPNGVDKAGQPSVAKVRTRWSD